MSVPFGDSPDGGAKGEPCAWSGNYCDDRIIWEVLGSMVDVLRQGHRTSPTQLLFEGFVDIAPPELNVDPLRLVISSWAKVETISLHGDLCVYKPRLFLHSHRKKLAEPHRDPLGHGLNGYA